MNNHEQHSTQSLMPMSQALLAIATMVFGIFAIMLLFIATFYGFAF